MADCRSPKVPRGMRRPKGEVANARRARKTTAAGEGPGTCAAAIRAGQVPTTASFGEGFAVEASPHKFAGAQETSRITQCTGRR